ncbi:hypothetical protein [Ruania halotolerans]|uniref:hypothetical protein n=1 Tax=Ruania halotolerans TaxID=2897773 RepID=UPI001E545016|nr:hypothetical protein [Ruania halotolerans]UFU05001.1 hypothetical protein LQF10_10965 [Ruania halotolerans]
MSARTNEAAGLDARSKLDAVSKLDAARRVLAAAEAGVGVRTRLDRSVTAAAVSQRATSATAPRMTPGVTSAMPIAVTAPAADVSRTSSDAAAGLDPERAFDVPAVLAPLFPAGLRRGSAVQVIGGTSVLLSLAASAVAGGAWCSIVDLPDLGLAAAAELGIPLERTVVVPRTGPDAAAVLGAVVDGVDVVILGQTAALADRERRTIAARVRVREVVLLTTSPWPGADVLLEVVPRQWHGIGQGSGVIQAGELAITAHHRRVGRSITVHAMLGARGWGPAPEGAEPAGAGARLTAGAGAAEAPGAGPAVGTAAARLTRAGAVDLQWRELDSAVTTAAGSPYGGGVDVPNNGPDGATGVVARDDLMRAG